MDDLDRREFLKLAGLGVGAVYASSLAPASAMGRAAHSRAQDFYFLQLSDTHWGFSGAKVNPDFAGTLKKTVKEINKLNIKPDFIVFTGDLTHTTDSEAERKKRMAEFQDVVSKLNCPTVHFMPGEHDASLDEANVYKSFFGETHYTFEHKGVKFIVLDNVSDPTGSIGEAQLAWLKTQLANLSTDDRIVIFTHRPLFDLYPSWDWATRDGGQALDLLKPYSNVTVFYGHIHQEHHHKTGQIIHHSAKSLMFPLPAPGSVPKREPIAWDANQPYKGIGYRTVQSIAKDSSKSPFQVGEYSLWEDD